MSGADVEDVNSKIWILEGPKLISRHALLSKSRRRGHLEYV